MGKGTHKVTGRIVTPKCETIYITHLRERRAFSRKERRSIPNDDGHYGITLAFNTGNRSHQEFIDTVNEANDEAFEACGGVTKKNLFKPIKDREGWVSLELKQPGENPPKVLDVKKKAVPDSVVNTIGSGSEVKAVFAYRENNQEESGGIACYLNVIQLINLVEYGDEGLLGEEEGFDVADFSEDGDNILDDDEILI
jgi:hypothetical protein